MWTQHPLHFQGRFWPASPVGVLPAPKGISRLKGWVKEFF